MRISGLVYKVTNLVNGKMYIGQTKQTITERWQGHKCAARYGIGIKGKRRFTYFLNAIKKHGAENFVVEVVDRASNQKQLDALERKHIRNLDTQHTGYNRTTGGEHPVHSEASKTKLSDSMRFQHAERRYERIRVLVEKGCSPEDIAWITGIPRKEIINTLRACGRLEECAVAWEEQGFTDYEPPEEPDNPSWYEDQGGPVCVEFCEWT